MEGSAQSLWERCLPIIRNNVDEKQYRTWFEPIQIISFEKQVLTCLLYTSDAADEL